MQSADFSRQVSGTVHLKQSFGGAPAKLMIYVQFTDTRDEIRSFLYFVPFKCTLIIKLIRQDQREFKKCATLAKISWKYLERYHLMIEYIFP